MAIIGFIVSFLIGFIFTVILPLVCLASAAFSGDSREKWYALVPFAVGCVLLYFTITNAPFHITFF